ncbi:MAG: hypothetical protein WC867_00840 [Candidatus Pacearchaeota archaeon]|jgi:NOL1/NOP2/fmu family ribosome biogenesis protein
MKILSPSDKKRLLEQLNEQYGIEHLPFIVLKFGEEKLRIFTSNLSNNELYNLDTNLRIETAGLYFAKWEVDKLRLTFDGVQFFKSQISKNILEIDNKNALEWLKGNELYIQSDKNWKILKNNNELLGCGKATGEKITNFMAKERRIR